MEFIKRFIFSSVEYRVFYDEDLKVLNYFRKDENIGICCYSIKFNYLKEFIDVFTKDSFKEKAEEVFKSLLGKGNDFIENKIIIHIFDNDFWEKNVLNNFNNYQFKLIKIPNRQTFIGTYNCAISVMKEEAKKSDNPYSHVPITFLESEKERIIRGSVYDKHGYKYYFESEYVS